MRPTATNPDSSPRRGPARMDPTDKTQLKEHPVKLKRVAEMFRPHRWTLLVVALLISAASVVGLAQPFLVRAIIDDALPNQNVRLLAVLAGAMVAVAAATAAIGVIQTWMATRMGQRVMHTLRTSLFKHLQRQSLGFFTRTRGGEVQSRIINDISGMQGVITSTATAVASNLTTAVATLVAMVSLSPGLTLISLLVLPPAIWLSRRVALLRRDITSARQRELADMHTLVEEGLSVSGVRLTKTLGATSRNDALFEGSSERLVDLELRSQLAGRWRMATMSIVFAALPAAIYLAAGLPIASGGMTIGTVVAFTALQSTLFRPVMSLLDVGVQWVSAMALFSRIFEYLDLEPDVIAPTNPVAIDPRHVAGEVRIENVSFSYGDEPVLKDLELTIPAGTTTAVVGPTGSGKSTLGSLLARLHDPIRGRVMIDGIDIRRIALEDLAGIVGVVSQETFLIHASVRDNLLLAKPEASEQELIAALKVARLDETVTLLPDGLDTIVGSRGHRFSGGERQRLAIARTILRDPRILVLDEATSALDNATEAEVQEALDALASGRTTLTIAHRLSTIEHAEQVVVLRDGRIIERGSVEALLAADGEYANLAKRRGGGAGVPALQPASAA